MKNKKASFVLHKVYVLSAGFVFLFGLFWLENFIIHCTMIGCRRTYVLNVLLVVKGYSLKCAKHTECHHIYSVLVNLKPLGRCLYWSTSGLQGFSQFLDLFGKSFIIYLFFAEIITCKSLNSKLLKNKTLFLVHGMHMVDVLPDGFGCIFWFVVI